MQRQGGRVLKCDGGGAICRHAPDASFAMNAYDIHRKQLTIQGSFIDLLSFSDAMALLASGKADVEPLIGHVLGLEQVQDFLDGKISGVSKVVVRIQD